MLQVRSKRGSRSGQSLLRGVTRSHRDTGSSCCTMTTRLHCARLRCHGWGRRDVWRKVMLKTDAGRMYHLADVHVHVGQDNKKKMFMYLVLRQTWDKQFLPYVLWIIKRVFLPMLQATNVFACSLPRSKQLFAGISYSVSWFMRETIAPKALWAETTYHVDDSGNRRRKDVTREDKKYNAERHFVRAASLRSRNACQISQDSRNACQDFTRATLYRIYR